MTVQEIVERVIGAWGGGKWHTPAAAGGAASSTATSGGHGTAHHEATFLKLDIAKAATLLNEHSAISTHKENPAAETRSH